MSAITPFAVTQESSANIIRLSEWECRTFPQCHLSEADHELRNHLGEDGEGRLQIDELREGLRVRATSWVGVVRLETIEIRVFPKLAGGHQWLARLLDFTSGIEGLTRFRFDIAAQAKGDSLLDFIALLFVEATERLLRQGLMSGYIEREEELGVARGRILADRQVLQRFGQLDRIVCRFDEFDHDIDENRLLLGALSLAVRRVRSPSLHRRLSRLRAVLEPVCDPSGLDLDNLRREISYNRTNAHYKQAHELAWLILDASGINDLMALGSTRSFAFLLDMNMLFERFVKGFVERRLEPDLFRVEYQAIHSSVIWDSNAGKPYSQIIPDLVVSRRDDATQRLAIDAKYKLYNRRKIDPNDIYQTFLYAYALSSRRFARNPTALLLYPLPMSETSTLRLEVRALDESRGANINAMGIPIPDALREVESNVSGPVTAALRGAVSKALEIEQSRKGS